MKPRIVVSRCIEFEHCRWNGLVISSEFVRKLDGFVEFVKVCPEVEIGLGIPREPIRIVRTKGELRLVQPATGRDVTDEMVSFSERFLDALPPVDGFILKSRSPSCGLKEAKIHASADKPGGVGKGSGFFASAVSERYPMLPVEDEGRLTNFRIREHFLTRIFALARFRAIRESGLMKDVVSFQAANKLLLMAYNQTEMRKLGRIVANPEKRPVGAVLDAYEEGLMHALDKPSRFTSDINVLMHALGYFSKKLGPEEKAFFLDTLEQYRNERIPLSACLSVIRSWIARFGEPYLKMQSYFEPYPTGLVEITDSGKGRKL
ncbi:MAG TPA: DUF1722 domain-containing protein [Candidatus Eisenbacteria bacterium]|uniref:DUF1722 domain-containing protein n=1 Tax=Eiseniibacteriota bacterium TaxID=2212470 RepID=A0A7V2F3D4_UNCEI|nr:DUF1722 domain-containing protein [Candidatus Eisenbacteria bacterium]